VLLSDNMCKLQGMCCTWWVEHDIPHTRCNTNMVCVMVIPLMTGKVRLTWVAVVCWCSGVVRAVGAVGVVGMVGGVGCTAG